MDQYCIGCGEPWDICYITDDIMTMTPEEREADGWDIQTDSYLGKERRIDSCPCCKANREAGNADANRTIREFAAVAHDILGDDIDGIAAMMEDAEYFGMLDD